MTARVGFGYDSHVFDASRPLVLGGVHIAGSPGLRGHSDGDAVAHAIIDSLLGAAGMGDIGRLFPDADERWRGADSMVLLADVRQRLRDQGFTVLNVDTTVVTEAPKLAPHVDNIRDSLARTLGLPVAAVSVKAKTNEGMDDVGSGKGLQVFAVTSLGAR